MRNHPTGRPQRRALKSMAILVALSLNGCSGTEATTAPIAVVATTTAALSTTALATTVPATTVATTTPAPSLAEICPGTGTVAHRDIAYKTIEGVDPNLLSLDIYEPVRDASCPAAPIMVYVHGGGWRRGDKEGNAAKISWFNEMGWVFVSINYRLSPTGGIADLDPARVMFPTHNEEAGAAFAWVHDNAAQYGADPSLMSIMGHSAGAGIASAVATNERYIGDHGLPLDTINCAVALDTVAVDIRAGLDADVTHDLYVNAFGTDPADWDDASPMNHVAGGKGIPDFLVVAAGPAFRTDPQQRFTDALQAAGASAEMLFAVGLDHGGVNKAIGSPDDAVITPVLGQFLEGCG